MINCSAGWRINEAGTSISKGNEFGRMPPHQRTRLGLARSFQLPKPFASMTVLENLAIPVEYVAHRGHHKVSTKAEAASVHEDAMEILELIGLADRANHH